MFLFASSSLILAIGNRLKAPGPRLRALRPRAGQAERAAHLPERQHDGDCERVGRGRGHGRWLRSVPAAGGVGAAQAQAEQQLRQEWGKTFEENVKKAGSVAKANLGVDVLDMQLKDGTRLGDHPDIIKGFAKIADMMSEDTIVATESENVDQGKDIEQEISRIMNDRTGPYWNKTHPDHDKIVQQVYTLRSMKDGK